MDLLMPFKRLTAEHHFLPFDCGDEDLNNYLLSDALSYQNQLLSVTYFLENKEDTILFFSLSNDKIAAVELANSFWRKVKSLFPYSKHRKDYPAVKIGRLGVNVKFQHQDNSWGAFILNYIKRWMVSENKTGCRFITVDAYLSAVPFYLKNGFLFMGREEQLRYELRKGDTVAMYFDLMQII